MKKVSDMSFSRSQSGNIFSVLVGAVAVVGVVSVVAYTTLTGPISSAARTSNATITKNQIISNHKLIVMDAMGGPTGGDCDGDGAVEPRPWRTGAGPTGGGLLPNTIGLTVKDPWNSDYGYCVWDVGAQRKAAGCGGAAANRLSGSPTPTAGNIDTQTVIAVISPGPDRIFQSTCVNYVNATTPVMTVGGDDIVQKYTYAESATATSLLWSLKMSDPATTLPGTRNVEIGSDISLSTAGAISALAVNTTGAVNAAGGVRFGNETTVAPGGCDNNNAGLTRFNTVSGGLEVCNGINAWLPLGDGSTNGFDPAALCANTTHIGNVRYNTTVGQPQYCGTSALSPFVEWKSFMLAPTIGQLSITPGSYAATVQGYYTGGPSAWHYHAETFTVRNEGTDIVTLGYIAFGVSNNMTRGYTDTANTTCVSGLVLQPSGMPGDSCVIRGGVRHWWQDGNTEYFGYLGLNATGGGGSMYKTAPVHVKVVNSHCLAYSVFEGGLVLANCPSPYTAPGNGWTLIQHPGCSATPQEPACGGATKDTATSDPRFFAAAQGWTSDYVFPVGNMTLNDGMQNTANLMAYSAKQPNAYPAAQFCADLVLGGHDDWYLPSRDELISVLSHATHRTYFAAGEHYQTSTPCTLSTYGTQYNRFALVTVNTGVVNCGVSAADRRPVRCFRKHNTLPVAAQSDNNPEYFPSDPNTLASTARDYEAVFNHIYYANPGDQAYGFVNVSGITQDVSISISGAGNPAFRIEDGPLVTSGTIPGGKNTLVSFEATAGTAGTSRVITINIGGDANTATIYATDPSREIKMFTTSTLHTGNLGGIAGGDAICQARAAAGGLTGAATYRALLQSTVVANKPHARFPDDAGRIVNMRGELVAINKQQVAMNDLLMPIGYDETGALITTNTTAWFSGWANITAGNLFTNAMRYHCVNWTNGNSGACELNCGTVSYVTSASIASSPDQTCNTQHRLICYGPN